MLRLFLIFTVVPVVELLLLVELSTRIGFWPTIVLVIGTGFLGAVLARWQGWLTMLRVKNEMRQGIIPAQAIGHGALILIAGLLLITPGVLTDILGLSLLIPPLRKLLLKGFRVWMAANITAQTGRVWRTSETDPFDRQPTGGTSRVLEAEVIESHIEEDAEVNSEGPKNP